MHIIENNPYRQLGIFANSPVKERVANSNRLKAFLKVGKQVNFPLDLTQFLPQPNRTAETVTQAETSLTLPKEQLKYAQFWFLKVTPLDDIAFNHLFVGHMDEAIAIWQKKDDASSLQNRLVCALISKKYADAIACAELLYSTHIQQFASAVMGDKNNTPLENIASDFIDILCNEVGSKTIQPLVTNEKWIAHINENTVKPLIEEIHSAIDAAKAKRGKGSIARYDAGIKLMNVTKTPLQQLGDFLPYEDLQYQMIADKLGLEILQCGIDYFNDSDAPDAAHKAMTLQSYAQKIVVGKMAKDRCKENTDILKNIIANLPPAEVFEEDKAIKEELREFCRKPETISCAVDLLNATKPHLQSIGKKLGSYNSYYLKLSTQVVANALHNVIEEVNSAQQYDKSEYCSPLDSPMVKIYYTLRMAWNATRLMDTFDMESDFKTNRYNQNRAILKRLCEQIGICTENSTIKPSTSSKPTVSQPIASSQQKTENKTTVSKDSEPSGCLIAFIAWIVLGCIAGSIIVACDGDFAAGFFISGFIVLAVSSLTN